MEEAGLDLIMLLYIILLSVVPGEEWLGGDADDAATPKVSGVDERSHADCGVGHDSSSAETHTLAYISFVKDMAEYCWVPVSKKSADPIEGHVPGECSVAISSAYTEFFFGR